MPAVYDKYAGNYDRCFAPLERLGLAEWRREALGLIPAGSRILELGCGAGANSAFYPRSPLAVSSELSIKMLEVAKPKRGANHLVQADAQSLPFGEGEFDSAFATLVFCSIPDPSLAFAEARRVLRPGGQLVLLEHVRPPGLLGPLFDGINKISRPLFDDHFNRETLSIALDSGFKAKKVDRKLLGVVNLMELYSTK
ncbi:MAG: methyltransferase domain-containing protein [Chloracidobacterium sp.]|nr:methyltransferase domain-containing protein [Chloracidobacterium sp.]